ncbi:gas vesicle protein [Streptomyces sp. NPDC014646]|uniref:gas vesicle protein n=1 Tax=unclassified Streptomyces TaxID=2593676 RepID=UPI0036F6C27C
MTEPVARRLGDVPSRSAPYGPYGQGTSANLADILERVLDKGIVIAGDIRIDLLDIELLTIKLRLLVASVDKAKEMGIDWWEHDPSLSSRAHDGYRSLTDENERLRAEIEALRRGAEPLTGRQGESTAEIRRGAPHQEREQEREPERERKRERPHRADERDEP